MSGPSKSKRKRKGKGACITLPYAGDHGTGTAAAREGALLVPIKSDPNRRARIQRIDAYKRIPLTMRQEQAARAIRDAYCRVEMLSSGGPLKERIQSSPKPDQTIDVQVAAQSALHWAMAAVSRVNRPIVEHVLWHNRSLRSLNIPRCGNRLRDTLDRVADHIGS